MVIHFQQREEGSLHPLDCAPICSYAPAVGLSKDNRDDSSLEGSSLDNSYIEAPLGRSVFISYC